MSAPLDPKTAAEVLEDLRLQILTSAGGGPLRAITLHQPWAWAILHAGKTVENRGWPLAWWATGKWFALHAGVAQSAEADDAEWIRTAFGLQVPASMGRGLVGLVKFGTAYKLEASPYSAGDGDRPTPWECGPVCWPITDRLALPEPIAIRGAQGFWFVPPAETAQVLAQLERAAGAEARP